MNKILKIFIFQGDKDPRESILNMNDLKLILCQNKDAYHISVAKILPVDLNC